jgi:hypothetical protein
MAPAIAFQGSLDAQLKTTDMLATNPSTQSLHPRRITD